MDEGRGAAMEETSRELFPGVRLTAIRTDRFPRGFFSVHLLRPLAAEDASRNALLMNVLCRGTRTLPDRERICSALKRLPGVSPEPDLRQMGEVLAVGLRSPVPAGSLRDGAEDPLAGSIALLGEMLLDPATRGGLLREDYVREESRSLYERVLAATGDARNRAILKARQRMFAGEHYAVCPLGEAEEALRVRYQPLTRFYREALRSSPMELIFCGGAEYGRVEEAVRRAFMTLPGGGSRPLPETTPASGSGELRRVTEETDLPESILVLGFRFRGITPADDPALAVFRAIFSSGLSAAGETFAWEGAECTVDRFKKAVLVSAVVRGGRQDEAEEGILAQLRNLAEGRISREALDASGKNVAAAYLRGLESPAALCDFRLEQNLLGIGGDLRQYAALAAEVKAEDVQRIAGDMLPELALYLRAESHALN